MPDPKMQLGSVKTPKLILYDLHQVAHFLSEVAYAIAAANNTKIVNYSFLSGGSQLTMSDVRVIRAQADQLASTLMSQFSALCKTGSETAVNGFLTIQQGRYLDARQLVDATFAKFYKSNDALQRDLGIAKDVAHIVHGAANATFNVLSIFVTGGGGGMLAANTLNMADSMISDSIVGVFKDTARDQVLEKVGDKFGKKASGTLTNILDRDWKYAGALENAHVRLVTQTGVAVGARTLSFYFTVDGIKKNFGEIDNALKSLASQSPEGNYPVNSIPALEIPQQL